MPLSGILQLYENSGIAGNIVIAYFTQNMRLQWMAGILGLSCLFIIYASSPFKISVLCFSISHQYCIFHRMPILVLLYKLSKDEFPSFCNYLLFHPEIKNTFWKGLWKVLTVPLIPGALLLKSIHYKQDASDSGPGNRRLKPTSAAGSPSWQYNRLCHCTADWTVAWNHLITQQWANMFFM